MNKKADQQIASTILMVRPKHFGFNTETATDNAFQQNDKSISLAEIQAAALKEFDQMVALLRSNHIEVIVEEDTDEPLKTDAIFPNNWFSTHADGTIITYPMMAASRRKERRIDIVNSLIKKQNYSLQINLEGLEQKGEILEGTGSLILDRANRIAYAALSQRTHPKALQHFCELMNYTLVGFDASDESGTPIYHTNVMMTLGRSFAILALDTVADGAQQEDLKKSLESTNKEIIEISRAQVNAFAGNMLQVQTAKKETILVMSQQAFQSLNAKQVNRIQTHTRILSVPLFTIEKYGGGSARCMMAEIF